MMPVTRTDDRAWSPRSLAESGQDAAGFAFLCVAIPYVPKKVWIVTSSVAFDGIISIQPRARASGTIAISTILTALHIESCPIEYSSNGCRVAQPMRVTRNK